MLIVQDAELAISGDQQFIAISVEGTDLQSLDLALTQFGSEAVAHLSSSVIGISKGDNLVGKRMALANQSSNALDENGRFTRTSARDDQHGAVNVIDRLLLLRVGNDE